MFHPKAFPRWSNPRDHPDGNEATFMKKPWQDWAYCMISMVIRLCNYNMRSNAMKTMLC